MKLSTKVIALALTTLGVAAASNAQDIRIITPRISAGRIVGIYEVIEGSRTAGGFVNRAYNLYGFRMDGYTDRVARGEIAGTLVFGSGVLQNVGVTANGSLIGFRQNVALPFFQVNMVSVSPFFRNVDLFASQNGRTVWKRLPIGTR